MNKIEMNIQRLSCLVELTTGTALLLTPGLAMTLIVGSSLPDGGNQMAQLFGAAIICLGLSCWSKNQASGRDVMPSIGLTTYNILSGLLLASFSVLRRCKRVCRSSCSAASHRPWRCALQKTNQRAALIPALTVGSAAKTHMTGRRIQRLSHQGRRPEPMAVVIGAQK